LPQTEEPPNAAEGHSQAATGIHYSRGGTGENGRCFAGSSVVAARIKATENDNTMADLKIRKAGSRAGEKQARPAFKNSRGVQFGVKQTFVSLTRNSAHFNP
jgi:hypothetical protein